ncbi:STY0301 family protein [Dyella acidiphila]|uniref:Uncharacterized protein n=1 Tax=Dyella acidiphila TaxID=2775866 RepID=A0ABR9GA48_9GAMM|nr:STY0301 family protein [Dyella acidiphila]MBE1160905.1 hypothetical protein [Dyella acidiphila]
MATKGTNITRSSAALAVVMAIPTCAACDAAAKHHYQCPSSLADRGSQHALVHADVFDGPPEDKAFLRAWGDLKGGDIYLVCSYAETDKVVSIHAIGVNTCGDSSKPSTAYCD